jgi:GNAT superfamily N-acetyltransferase
VARTTIPAGQVATVVTVLEMTARPAPRPLPPSPLRLERWRRPGLDAYRALFRRVGGPWLWYSRLAMPDAQLRAILDDPAIEVNAAVDRSGVEVGFLELDFRHAPVGELSYFGLVPEWVGRGGGGWLMTHALAQLWRPGVERVRVATCTLDHPRALGFYRHQGFRPTQQWIETFADPRAVGLLPPDSAPHVPMLR